MSGLLMITGLGSAIDLASGKRGAFYYTLEEFHKYWDRIDIISPKFRGSTSGAFEAEPFFENVYIHISPHSLIFHPIWFVKKALALHREQKFDLMTVQEFPPFYNGIGAWIISILTKIPYVLEIHHIPGYPKAGNIKEKIYRQLMDLFIRFDTKRAKAVRVVNRKEAPDFLIKAGVPPEKITYIPSAYIDLSVFKPMGLSKKYDLIFVGRLEKNKGINLLLKALKILNTKHLMLNTKLLIVGDGSMKKYLVSNIKYYGLESQVTLHGFAKDASEIARLLNESKILVMPSYNEGGPRVVLEAMACGVPVLATPVGIVPDLLKNGLGGEIIRWEANDIARKAHRLLNDPETYKNHRQEGLKLTKKFERKEAIKNYYEVISRYAKS